MRKLLLALVPALLAGACSSPYSADGYCTKTAETYCKFMYKCCTPSERLNQFGLLILLGGAHTNYDQCKDKATKLMCASLSPYGESVKAGRGEWDEAKAQECMKTLEEGAESCDAQKYFAGNEGQGCDLNGDIFKGKVAEGGACFFDAECSSTTNTCITRTSTDPTKPLVTAEGTCKGLPRDGEPCADGDCASGHYCDSSDLCRPQIANGNLCDRDRECQSERCAYDSSSGDDLCTAKLADAENCFSSSDCQSGNCDDSSGECAPKRANGTACSDDGECQSNFCDWDSGTCKTEGSGSGTTSTYDLCDGNDIDAPLMTLAVEPQLYSAP